MLNVRQQALSFGVLSVGAGFIACPLQSAIVLWVAFATSLVISVKGILRLSHRRTSCQSSWVVNIVQYISKLQKLIETPSRAKSKLPDLTEINHINVEGQTDLIVKYVSRDFIESWFLLLSDSRTVIDEHKRTLSDLKRGALHVLSQTDKYIFLQKCVALYHKHLQEFQNAQTFINIQPKYRYKRDRSKEFKKVKSIEELFEADGLFHHAIVSKESEITYLSTVLDLCFKEMLAREVYKCYPACDLVIDIISTNALLKLLDLISDSHWLHFFIIKLTSDEDLELVKETIPLTVLDQTQTNADNSVEIGETTMSSSEVNFYLESDEHDLPSERPNPIGCTGDIASGSTEFEFAVTKSDNKGEELESSIQRAERNGLFDLSFFARSVSGQDLESSQVEQAEDAWAKAPERYEQPLNLVVELNVTGSEKMKEPGTMGVYTIYAIEYLAWYKTSGGTWQIQSRNVKRRYREFVALQERLEEHPTLKRQLKKIKGIKGPSKWLNLPFSRMDEAHINKRRTFLMQYLRSIVDNRELSYSLAVREFLAYEGDPGIAFVRKPSDVQRIDQVFVQTVKSVGSALEKFTDSLPSLSEPKEQGHTRKVSHDISHTSSEMWISGLDPDDLHVRGQCMSRHLTINIHASKLEGVVVAYDTSKHAAHDNMMSSYDDDNVMTSSDDDDMATFHEAFHDALDVNHMTTVPRLQADGSDSEDCMHGVDNENPMTQCLLDLALQTVSNRECWVQDENAVKVFKVLLGQFLDRFVRNELDEATTPARCAYYFWELTDTLWPNGHFDASPTRVVSAEQQELTRRQARRCLYEFFPAFLPHIIGQDDFNYGVDQVMASLDHPQLNRHFALCLLDLAVEQVFPKICTSELQKQLLQVTDQHYTPVDTSP